MAMVAQAEPAEEGAIEEEEEEDAPHNSAPIDPAEGALFLQHLLHALGHPALLQDERSSSHEELCARMREQLSDDDVAAAFTAVDRAHFVGEENVEAGAEESVYSDRPFRGGFVHLSAPSIYAQCLEALELREGLSFLNVGSGTGYLSALAAQMLGPHACHHAVELKQGLVDHSMRKARRKPAQDPSVAMPTHPRTNHGPCYPALTPHPNPCRTAGASRPLFDQGAPRRAA